MRTLGYLVGGLLIAAACGETQREFASNNALDNPDAHVDSGAIAPSGDADHDAEPPGEAQTGYVPPPGVTSDVQTEPDAGAANAADLDAALSSSENVDAAPLPMSECQSKEYDAFSINEPEAFPGVRNIYFYGDSVTTACVTHDVGRVCIEGNAPTSSDGTDDFKNWGFGLGMYLATSVPFDAPALGIEKVRFSLTNVVGRSVRIAITQVPDPDIVDESLNYQNNAFVYGGSQVNDVASDVVITAKLAEFALPPWTNLADPTTGEPAVGRVLDASQLASFQVQIVNGLEDAARMYSYCVSGLEWLDASDVPVEPVVAGEQSTEAPTP